MSLLERHLRMLNNAGVDDIVLALGYRHERVEAELDRLRWQPRPEIVLNSRYELGSVLTVHTVADALTRWQAALADRPEVAVRVHRDANHLFFPGTGQATPAEYARPGHVAPAVVDEIATWLARR